MIHDVHTQSKHTMNIKRDVNYQAFPVDEAVERLLDGLARHAHALLHRPRAHIVVDILVGGKKRGKVKRLKKRRGDKGWVDKKVKERVKFCN